MNNDAKRYLDTVAIVKKQERDKAKARAGFVIIMAIWILGALAYSSVADAQVKKWHLEEVQYQISEDCSTAINVYARQAAREMSKHTVKFRQGIDTVYVSCEPTSPFKNALSYLAPGTDSEDEHFTLGTTRTTWYVSSLEIIKAHVWIDPIYAPIYGDLKGVLIHEWGHAVGEGHTSGGIMQSNAQGNYLDAHTIARLRARYDKPAASVMDSEGDYYISCLWVPQVIAKLVGEREGYYFTQTRGGEIVDFGPSDCD